MQCSRIPQQWISQFITTTTLSCFPFIIFKPVILPQASPLISLLSQGRHFFSRVKVLIHLTAPFVEIRHSSAHDNCLCLHYSPAPQDTFPLLDKVKYRNITQKSRSRSNTSLKSVLFSLHPFSKAKHWAQGFRLILKKAVILEWHQIQDTLTLQDQL